MKDAEPVSLRKPTRPLRPQPPPRVPTKVVEVPTGRPARPPSKRASSTTPETGHRSPLLELYAYPKENVNVTTKEDPAPQAQQQASNTFDALPRLRTPDARHHDVFSDRRTCSLVTPSREGRKEKCTTLLPLVQSVCTTQSISIPRS